MLKKLIAITTAMMITNASAVEHVRIDDRTAERNQSTTIESYHDISMINLTDHKQNYSYEYKLTVKGRTIVNNGGFSLEPHESKNLHYVSRMNFVSPDYGIFKAEATTAVAGWCGGMDYKQASIIVRD